MLHELPDAAFNLPAPLRKLARHTPALSGTIHYLWRIGERWRQDQCPLQAAAMAFFGLFSVFPLVLAAIVILAQVLSLQRGVLNNFQQFVVEFFPGQTGAEISHQIEAAVASLSGSDATTIGVFALLSLLWSGRAFFMVLATVLNGIWASAAPRTFLQQQFVLWTTFIAAGALWLTSTLISLVSSALLSFARAFQARLQQYAPELAQSWMHRLPLAEIASHLSSWLLTTLMFWLIYWFLPNVQRRRRRRVVLACALGAAAAWELFRVLYAGFLGNMFNYAGVYGSSVAGVVGTMMWIYFSSLILLLGAESASAYEEMCEYLAHKTRPAPLVTHIKFVPENDHEP